MGYSLFDQKMNKEIQQALKVEPVDEQLKATTCNQNEQQKDAKNKAELQTKWTKMTWKTPDETIR